MGNLNVATGTLPAGFQFGAYVIGGCIGQGGMARIYRAEHRVLRKPVALKVMESVLLERPDGRPRFLREGQAAAAVKHPNVVDITDVGVWQGRPYLVMELLEGEDLEQYLNRQKPLAETDVARLMIPVIAGLATAHASGVIHRDLKPSNVFLSRGPDGETVPKLLDFGISKLANGLQNLDLSATPLGELMGSPMYMSPEAVRGARDLTPQSDQYSLGVVLYECVTGRPPFHGDSLLSVLEAVARGTFDSPRKHRPDLSNTLEVAILRAMSREPTERFANVRDLGRALCEAADHRTRLLWTPSFGLRDARNTAAFGPSPVMTASPLSASVTRRSAGKRGGRMAWLGAAALLAFGMGFFVYGRAPMVPYSEGVTADAETPATGLAVPAAVVQPSTESVAPARALSPLEERARPEPSHDLVITGGEAAAELEPAKGASEGKVLLAPNRARAPRPRVVAADERPPARNARLDAPAPEASPPEEVETPEWEPPSRPAAASRSRPVLGANQSPILD